MKFILNKDTLEIENIEIVKSGSVNYYEADVEYDESWNDLAIEAVMLKKDEEVGKSIAVINNKMYIDQKLRGTYCVGFVGYKIQEEKKIYQVSTNLQKVYFDLGAGEIETENVEVPTPTEWEIYNAQIQEFIKQGQAVVDEANNLNVELKDNILTITKKDGTQYSENVKGDKGDKGDAGSIKFIVVNELPTENIDESAMYLKPSTNPEEQNSYEEYVYANGAWESLGTAQVEVDLKDYVKDTDYSTSNKAGVVKTYSPNGIQCAGGFLYIVKATDDQIKNRSDEYRPIVPANLKQAVESVVGGHITLTQAEYDDLVSAGTIDENTYYYIKEE